LGSVTVYSPDGRLLAMSDRNEVQVRDARTLTLITNLVHLRPLGSDYTFRVLSLAISTNFMAAGYRYGEVKLWDLKTWEELASWKADTSFLTALDFSPDGTLLATAGTSRRIQLWELASILKKERNHGTITALASLQGHTGQITAVMFSTDGRTLASSSADGTARLWSIRTVDQPIPLFETDPADDKGDWWFLEDGKRVIYADEHNQLYRCDISDARHPQRLMAAHTGIRAVSPDGKMLALRADDGSIELWGLDTGERQQTFQHEKSVNGLAFAQAGRLLISSHEDGEIRIKDLRSEHKEVVLNNLMEPPNWTRPFYVSADGRVLAARRNSTQIGLWNLPECQPRDPLDVPFGVDETLALSQDGRWLAVSSWPQNSVVLWDLASPQPRKMPVSEAIGIFSMAFAPDGKTLVIVTYDETVSFWNLATLQEIMREENLAGNYGEALFSPNGEYLALPLALRYAPSLAEIDAKERAKLGNQSAAEKDGQK
jgi:WD40 repeat protein